MEPQTAPTRLTSLSRSVAGRTVLVTGAASGMGRATAHLFADEGARVAVVDRVADGVDRVVAEIAAVHGEGVAAGFVGDIASEAMIDRLVTDVEAALGPIDTLINNAGVSLPNSPYQETDAFEESWARTLDVNLTAHARLVRRSLPSLLAAGSTPRGGRVVNIASTEAIVATAGLAAYAATKAGVLGLTRSLAVELGRAGITVNAICPGPIETGMTAPIPPETKAVYAKRRVPLRRYGHPEEVAHLTVSLCMPAASYVNGVALPVDGGMSIRHT